MILLLGGTGYIGSAIAAELARRKLSFIDVNRVARDYTQTWVMNSLINLHHPAAIINAAAYVGGQSVDNCEDQKPLTYQVNTLFPTKLAIMCEEHQVPLLHISTGCLFNGHKDGHGYSEDDPIDLTPEDGAGTYVSSKVLAERAVRQRCERHWICRIRLPFDHIEHPRNLLTKYLRFDKIYPNRNSLTHRQEFAELVCQIIQKRIPWGTYHCTNVGSIRTESVVAYMRSTGVMTKDPVYFTESGFMDTARTLKSNCTLSVKKLASLGLAMRPVDEAMEDSILQYTGKPLATSTA